MRASLQGLEWLGAEQSGKVRGLTMLAAIGGDDEDGDDEVEGWLEKFLQYMLKQFWSLGFMWMTLTDKAVGRWMAKLKDLGPVVVPLPWLRGLGPGLRIDPFDPSVLRGTLDDFAGPLLKSVEVDDVVRAIGRAVGDASVAPLFAIGWGLTLLPEQIRNVTEGLIGARPGRTRWSIAVGFSLARGRDGWLASAWPWLDGQSFLLHPKYSRIWGPEDYGIPWRTRAIGVRRRRNRFAVSAPAERGSPQLNRHRPHRLPELRARRPRPREGEKRW